MIYLLLIVGLVFGTRNQSPQCEEYVQKLIRDLSNFNISGLPLPSLVYSGITTNNPGQMQECTKANYTYYLVHFKDTAAETRAGTFTGVCVPDQCSATDIEIALQYLHSNVYEYSDSEVDALSVIGAVVCSLWVAVLIVWSCVISFRSPDNSEFIKEQKQLEQKRHSLNDGANEKLLDSSEQSVKAEEYTIFNYYKGYKRIFVVPGKRNILAPILFLAVFSYSISTEYSYRQSISENQSTTAADLLSSFTGVLVCNTEIALSTIIFVLGLRLAFGTYEIKTFRGMGRYFFDELLRKWLLLILMTLLVYSFLTLFVDEPLFKIWSLGNGKDCPGYMWQMWFLVRNLQLDCKVCLPWFSLICAYIFLTLLSAPFIVIYKVNKKLGYGLLVLVMFISMIASAAILDNQAISYEPNRLMNSDARFSINYQGNTFVRMGAFYLGVMLGLVVVEGKYHRTDIESGQQMVAQKLKESPMLAMAVQLLGLAIMIAMYLLIIPHLGMADSSGTVYAYLIIVPFVFVAGLALFLLPSFAQSTSRITMLTNEILGWSKWVHFDRISVAFFMLAPMVIGFTTYSMQSSIYYDLFTVNTYLLGDLFMTYVLSLVCTAAFENQLIPIISWLQVKIFGSESRPGVLVIEEL